MQYRTATGTGNDARRLTHWHTWKVFNGVAQCVNCMATRAMEIPDSAPIETSPMEVGLLLEDRRGLAPYDGYEG